MSRFSSKQEDVTLELQLVHETDKAFLVSDDGVKKVWLPKSQIISYELKFAANRLSEFVVPEWLAIDKELV